MKGRRGSISRVLAVISIVNIQFVLYSSVFLANNFKGIFAQPYKQYRCSNRLENALEHMRRRSFQVKAGRSYSGESPYSVYNSLYGQHDDQADDFYSQHPSDYLKQIHRNIRSEFPAESTNHKRFSFGPQRLNQRQPNKLPVARVDVEDLKVRMPSKGASRWVEVDKCNFSTENSTLDTRLIFPDLTISGKVVLQPIGGKCNMILRLRHAGIEFRTKPIGFESLGNEESRRLGAASVRTDSHFAEPGFISVFAHGCQGPTGIRLRQNSRRRFGLAAEHSSATVPDVQLSDPQVVMGAYNRNRWGKFQNTYYPDYDIRSENYVSAHRRPEPSDWNSDFRENNDDDFYRNPLHKKRRRRDTFPSMNYKNIDLDDEVNFNDDIFNIEDNIEDLVPADARAFADIFSSQVAAGTSSSSNVFSNFGDHEEVNDALTNELERIFSMGVRGLLTTYMQRALQPAIKETLMENMGYTLSYG